MVKDLYNLMTSRRSFIKGVGVATTVGVLGVGEAAANEPPSVPRDHPTISTYGHFSTDGGNVALSEDETPTSYDQEGDWSGFDDQEEVQIFVHGFVRNNPPAWARYEAKERAQEALNEADYYNPYTVAFNWDSNVGWADANEIATRNGAKLAQWIRDFRADDDRPVRIIAHSLGARVTCAVLDELKPGDGQPTSPPADPGRNDVDSVALLAAAISQNEPQMNEQFGPPIQFSAEECYNYHSTNDPALGENYLGHTGIGKSQKAPQNYTDRDVSSEIDGHSDYHKPDVGIMDQVVEDFS